MTIKRPTRKTLDITSEASAVGAGLAPIVPPDEAPVAPVEADIHPAVPQAGANTTPIERNNVYDPFAWVYNRHWGDSFADKFGPALQHLVLNHVPKKARILDLCCGTGQLTAKIARRGYKVIGLDASEEMLKHARENAPKVEFVLGDARNFAFDEPFHVVISAFDSLNHISDTAQLTDVFKCVRAALRPNGWFMFDLNDMVAYQRNWNETFSIIEDDHVTACQSTFSDKTGVARLAITTFRPDGKGKWTRQDMHLDQYYHDPASVRYALDLAGFYNINLYDGRDLEMTDKPGRAVFVCRRGLGIPASSPRGRGRPAVT